MPLVNLTRATFLKAEFGFLGLVVKTFKQTPLFNGEGEILYLFCKGLKIRFKAGAFVFLEIFVSWDHQ